MSSSDTPTLPRAQRISGRTMSHGDDCLVTYRLTFAHGVNDDDMEAVFRMVRSLKSEERIKAFSFAEDDMVVAALDWKPIDEPFRVYGTLHELFRPELPYCGVMVGTRTFTDDLCELRFAVAGIDQSKYEHFREGLEKLPHVVSAKTCEDTLSFQVVLHGTFASETGREALANSLKPLGIMLNIPPSLRVEVLGILI